MAYRHKTPHRPGRGNHRAVGAPGAPQRRDSRAGANARGHGAYLAGPVRRRGLPALADRRRSGRPSLFTSLHVAAVKALACQIPAETGTPLSHWSFPELTREVVARAITPDRPASTVRRWLNAEAIKPWRHPSCHQATGW
ncbi:helix-turn-helix domain-containing protein [Streptomyces melanogenes]|uniref:helix-turn-helix domain-containing protein n=1 Tax=Streptomyces melanogenes TaxID=67326 RepID=UPI003570B330